MRLLVILFIMMILGTGCTQQKTAEQYFRSGSDFFLADDFNSAIIEFKNALKQDPENANARFMLGRAYLKTYKSQSALKELKKAMQLGFDKQKLLLPLAIGYEQTGETSNLLKEIVITENLDNELKSQLMAYRARALIRTDRLNEARKLLEQAKAINGNDNEVRYAWALLEGVSGNKKAQLAWLQPLLALQPPLADAWSMKGDYEQSQLKFDAAEQAFSKAINARKVIHADYIKRAFNRLRLADFAGAEADLNALKKAGAKWPMVLQVEGLMFYQQKQFNEAKQAFEQNLSMYSNYAPSILMLGLTQFNLGNYQSAASNLERYLSDHQNNSQANFIYASTLLKLGRASDAMKLLEKLVSSNPDDYKLLSLLGGVYVSVGQLDKGIGTLQKAASLKPDLAKIRLQLGSAMLTAPTGSLSTQGQQELIKAVQLDPQLTRADLLLFSSYLKNRNFSKARKVAQDLSTKNPDKSLGENLLALVDMADNKVKQAVQSLQATLNKFPADPLTSGNLAKIYIRQGQFDKAKTLYQDVLNKHPDSLQAMNQLAFIAARQGNNDEVIKWLSTALEKNPDSLSASLMLASQYLRNKAPQQALEVLQNVKEDNKQKPEYTLLMARVKIEMNELTHAIRLLKQLVEKQPGQSAASFLLAQVYGAQNNAQKMRLYLEKTIKNNPNLLPAQLAMARLDLIEKKEDDFNNRLSYLLQSYPNNKEVQYLKARADSGKKDYGKAIETLSELMKDTSSPMVAMDLARNLWLSGDRADAISNLEVLTQNNPENSQALLLLAQYYLAENRLGEAEATYRKLDAIIPQNANVLNNLAWILQDSNPKQGLEYAQKALQYKPDSPFILDTLAVLLLKNNQPGKALETSSKAVQILPTSGDIQFNYAKILKANKQVDKANKIFGKLASSARSAERRRMIEAEMRK